MKDMLILGLLIFFNLLVHSLNAQEYKKLVLLKPTGEMKGDLPVMQVIPDTATTATQFYALMQKSFIADAIELHSYAQTYLKNTGKAKSIDPVWLALTQNQGGFARKGFILLDKNQRIEKADAYYLDLHERRLQQDAGKLMSMTQLFPHELGHIIHRLVVPGANQDQVSKASDMHYFSVSTDYVTAFSEGFAEHLENVARLNEPDPVIKTGVEEDAERISAHTAYARKAFHNDLKLPLRLGLFRAGMLAWYQSYENFKRYRFAIEGTARYKCKAPTFGNIEHALTYRNAGLEYDTTRLRNAAQFISNEGCIDAFFTKLTHSRLGEVYRPAAFYELFRGEGENSGRSSVSPVQNQFMKYVAVFSTYPKDGLTETAPLIDFVNGYAALFPDENEELLKIYHDVAGRAFESQTPPQVWMMAKNHPHRYMVIDPFGAVTIPFYTFNLNVAEAEDLMTVRGMSADDPQKIVDFRDQHVFFNSIPEIERVPNLRPEVIQAMIAATFDQKTFDQESKKTSELSVSRIVIFTLAQVFLRGLPYPLTAAGLVWLFWRRQLLRQKFWKICRTIVALGFNWSFYIIGSLVIAAVFPSPVLPAVLFCFALTGINLLFAIKDKARLKPIAAFHGMMILMVLYSII